MNTSRPRSLTRWRCVFLGLETALVVVFLACLVAERHFDLLIGFGSGAVDVTAGLLLTAAWLFLLVGSPFFFRSLRWVAWLGCAMAIGLLLWWLLESI
jgi:hypothetical protein